MTQREESLVTWFFMFASLMAVLSWACLNREFDDKCATTCAPARSISPLYNFQQTCFCDVGNGKWKMQNTDVK